MTRKVQFRLTNRLTRNTGQMVLVFLRPVLGPDTRDMHLNAWQTLNPAANGGSHPFTFYGAMQLAVEDRYTHCQSPLVDVRPNQLYTVSNDDNQGPVLNLSHGEAAPSSRQVAVRNTTDPAISLNATWLCDGWPILQQSALNLGITATFRLAPTFFFVVTQPPFGGPSGVRLQQFSRDFPYQVPPEADFVNKPHSEYLLPPGADRVEVTWTRPGGMDGADTLIFDPPSAPLVSPF
jgi:hypothetical protein